HVLLSKSCQTSTLSGRSMPDDCRSCISAVPPCGLPKITSSVGRNCNPTEAAPAAWSTRAKTVSFRLVSTESSLSTVSGADDRLCTDTRPFSGIDLLPLEACPCFDVAGVAASCWARAPHGHVATTPRNVNTSRRCIQRQSSLYRRLRGLLVRPTKVYDEPCPAASKISFAIVSG